MSIDAEIEALVSAFVNDLVRQVRELAEQSVREAFDDIPTLAGAARPRALKGTMAPQSETRGVGAPALVVSPAGASSSRSLDIWPSAVASVGSTKVASSAAVALPVVRKFPPKRRRVPRASASTTAPAPASTTAPSPREPVPAKTWVVVRRGASPAKAGSVAIVDASRGQANEDAPVSSAIVPKGVAAEAAPASKRAR